MPQITLLLHNIRSTHNVGSIFRSADGFGVERIILTGYTPHPRYDGDTRLPHIAQRMTDQINKTALGATSSVPFEYHDNPLTWLSASTLPVVGLEQSQRSRTLSGYVAPPEFILVLGEEVDGIAETLLNLCDDILEIPMQGMKESYNVSVAAGIALYALTT
ncbi:TrmH family RNA methyltransferase [Candidatus Saccharibacteria bacterium]|nr:TrmH family RNA methyltransferase [Candidatus Saccharibacteria bacterium]